MRINLVLVFLLFVGHFSSAQPGRDLEFKGEHQTFHFSNADLLPMGEDYLVEMVYDSVPIADRVYVTYDTIQGFMLNGHRFSVYEFPSVLRFALTNPAGKKYLPKDPSKATIILLVDYPIFDINYEPSYRTAIGPDYLMSSVVNVLFDIWNEDARYSEDTVFDLLSEEKQIEVSHRNPHRLQMLNYSDAYMADSPMFSEDEGISAELPEYSEEGMNANPPAKRNVIDINVGTEESIQFAGEPIELAQLSELLYVRMVNESANEEWPESLQSVIVSLRNQRATKYAVYLEVYDTILGVYKRLWNEAAIVEFELPYEELNDAQQKTIRQQIPLVISEAEPTNFGEED